MPTGYVGKCPGMALLLRCLLTVSTVACRILPQPSKVLAVSLPRPMGIVLEEDARRGRVVISGLAEGSEAAKRAKASWPIERLGGAINLYELESCCKFAFSGRVGPCMALAQGRGSPG